MTFVRIEKKIYIWHVQFSLPQWRKSSFYCAQWKCLWHFCKGLFLYVQKKYHTLDSQFTKWLISISVYFLFVDKKTFIFFCTFYKLVSRISLKLTILLSPLFINRNILIFSFILSFHWHFSLLTQRRWLLYS